MQDIKQDDIIDKLTNNVKYIIASIVALVIIAVVIDKENKDYEKM